MSFQTHKHTEIMIGLNTIAQNLSFDDVSRK